MSAAGRQPPRARAPMVPIGTIDHAKLREKPGADVPVHADV
ncbi:hypothetical protein [Streptomyces sp. NPDC002156]